MPSHGTALLALLLTLSLAAGCIGTAGEEHDSDGAGQDAGSNGPTDAPSGPTPPAPGAEEGDDGAAQEGAVQEVSGSLTPPLQAEGCAASRLYVAAGQVPLGTPADGVSRIVFDVDPGTIGQRYTAAWSFDEGYIEVATFFTSASGAVVSQRIVDSPDFGDVTLDGTVPAGAEVGVLFACGGPTSASVTYLSQP